MAVGYGDYVDFLRAIVVERRCVLAADRSMPVVEDDVERPTVG
jgi:hypothetical protein